MHGRHFSEGALQAVRPSPDSKLLSLILLKTRRIPHPRGGLEPPGLDLGVRVSTQVFCGSYPEMGRR